MCTESSCYTKINLFKYKRFKDGRCCYTIIVPSHLKQTKIFGALKRGVEYFRNYGMGCAARTPDALAYSIPVTAELWHSILV